MQIKKAGIICALLLVFAGIYAIGVMLYRRYTPIKVGVLHSLTGHMAFSERPVVDATLMAIEELNASGGLLGRVIEPIIADGASDEKAFARQAEWLVEEKKVDVIFGCWTSASRKEVKQVVEKYDNLLFYPVQFEGIETSTNIIYSGSTLNQQVFPAIVWLSRHIGTRCFIVGSDYIYPRIAGMMIRLLTDSFQATLVGEEYLLLGSENVAAVIEKIKAAEPNVIINLINGETNKYFFEGLRAAGITSDKIPTMSFSMGETEVQELGASLVAGDYASWSYFQSIQNRENVEFISAFKKRYGQERVLSDPMEVGYFNVYLWSQVVRLVQNSRPEQVMAFIQNQSRVVPEGIVGIDPFNKYAWRYCRIGKVDTRGQFDIVWSSEKAVYPVPYPFKPQEEWEIILQDMYRQWGNAWSKK